MQLHLKTVVNGNVKTFDFLVFGIFLFSKDSDEIFARDTDGTVVHSVLYISAWFTFLFRSCFYIFHHILHLLYSTDFTINL